MKKLATTVLVTLGLGTVLFACPAGGDGKRGGEYRSGMKQIMKQLDLTSEQREQLKTLRESRKAMRQAKRKSCKEDRQAMRGQMKPDMGTFMTGNTFDKEAFKQAMQKKFEAKRAMKENRKMVMMENRAANMEKVFNILTPEQRIKWIELSKKQKDPKQRNREGKNCKS